jgi:hypothetical protein
VRKTRRVRCSERRKRLVEMASPSRSVVLRMAVGGGIRSLVAIARWRRWRRRKWLRRKPLVVPQVRAIGAERQLSRDQQERAALHQYQYFLNRHYGIADDPRLMLPMRQSHHCVQQQLAKQRWECDPSRALSVDPSHQRPYQQNRATM